MRARENLEDCNLPVYVLVLPVINLPLRIAVSRRSQARLQLNALEHSNFMAR